MRGAWWDPGHQRKASASRQVSRRQAAPERVEEQTHSRTTRRGTRYSGVSSSSGSDSDGDIDDADMLQELLAGNCRNLFRIAKMFLADILASARTMPR